MGARVLPQGQEECKIEERELRSDLDNLRGIIRLLRNLRQRIRPRGSTPPHLWDTLSAIAALTGTIAPTDREYLLG